MLISPRTPLLIGGKVREERVEEGKGRERKGGKGNRDGGENKER